LGYIFISYINTPYTRLISVTRADDVKACITFMVSIINKLYLKTNTRVFIYIQNSLNRFRENFKFLLRQQECSLSHLRFLSSSVSNLLPQAIILSISGRISSQSEGQRPNLARELRYTQIKIYTLYILYIFYLFPLIFHWRSGVVYS